MSDPVIMAANERVKSVSRTLMQLGSALLAAAAIRVYADDSLSIEALGWGLLASAFLWVGWKILLRLESES